MSTPVRDEATDKVEIKSRLYEALYRAGRSPLGMPGTVDTFVAWLDDVGLRLALNESRP